MAEKEVRAKNSEDYVVKAEVDGFEYTQDFVGRNPNKKDEGTTPTGMLLASLSGCYLMTARSFFDRKNIDAKTLETNIGGDFNYDLNDGWAVDAKVTLTTDAPLDEEIEDQLRQFIDRYCKVSGVLSAGNNIDLNIEQV